MTIDKIQKPLQLLTSAFIGGRLSNDSMAISSAISNGLSVDQLVEFFRRNRVILLFERAVSEMEELPQKNEILKAIRPIADLARKRCELAESSTSLVNALALELEIPVFAIKGLVTKQAYPDPELREIRDADLAVRTAEEAFHLAVALREQGFSTDPWELPWIKADLLGSHYGQYRLIAPDGYGPVDIHFGSVYSTGHCGMLPLAASTKNGVDPIPLEDNLRPMLGNSGGDTHITLKDINDAYALFGALSDNAARKLVADARQAGVLRHLRAITGLTIDCARMVSAPVPDGLARIAQHTSGKVFRQNQERLLVEVESSNRKRVARTALSAFVQSRMATGNPFGRVVLTLGTLRYYTADLAPRLTSLSTAVPTRLKPWTCVRLLPASLVNVTTPDGKVDRNGWQGDSLLGVSEKAKLTKSSEHVPIIFGTYVLSNQNVFLPTVWGRFSNAARQEVREAELQTRSKIS